MSSKKAREDLFESVRDACRAAGIALGVPVLCVMFPALLWVLPVLVSFIATLIAYWQFSEARHDFREARRIEELEKLAVVRKVLEE